MQIDEKDYGQYFENDFRHRWLRPTHLQDKLAKYRDYSSLKFEKIGESVEGRLIEKISWGKGSETILLWTQMHGNEPTATMAVVDLLNFFVADDQHNPLRELLYEKLSIVIIPMLNPDGSELFTRRNALLVDLNRDARAVSMPEMKALMQQITSLKPRWAFNLHDQRNIFSVGKNSDPATLSFLAPSASPDRKMTTEREKSMRLISLIHQSLQQIQTSCYGRYSDEFYPTAIGDFLIEKKITCILIESGAAPQDDFRDQARKLNFYGLLEGFAHIAKSTYGSGSVVAYDSIPQNEKLMFDVLVKGCKVKRNEETFTVDLGFLFQEYRQGSKLAKRLILAEIGDLSRFNAFEKWPGGEIDFEKSHLTLNEPVSLSINYTDRKPKTLKQGIENEKY